MTVNREGENIIRGFVQRERKKPHQVNPAAFDLNISYKKDVRSTSLEDFESKVLGIIFKKKEKEKETFACII